jgi:hypothetical protein
VIELEHIKELEKVVVSSKNVINLVTVFFSIYPSQVMDKGATK